MLAHGIIARGPIEALDQAKGRVVLLGKAFSFGGSVAQMKALGARLASGESILATVTGAPAQNGVIKATTLSLSNGTYVPGTTEVMIVGTVKTVEEGIGAISIDGLRIDYSAILASGGVQFVPGQLVAVLGVRSAPNMPLIASAIKAL